MSNNTLTLREGLAHFHAAYTAELSHHQPGVSKEAKAFFRSHDVAHVLFGCDTSLRGEGAVKIWTIFGTTLGFWSHLKGYQSANALALSTNFGLDEVVRDIFKLLLSIPRIILKARRMHKSWPWTDYDSYLDQPIAKIREEFNIIVD